jgi:hypothetical protein
MGSICAAVLVALERGRERLQQTLRHYSGRRDRQSTILMVSGGQSSIRLYRSADMPRVLHGAKTMNLYEVPRNTKIKFKDNEGNETTLLFGHVDGMYSYCTDDNGNVVHLAAWADVEVAE